MNDDCVKRTYCDKVVNTFGSDLLELCKAYSLRILNRRTGSDKQIGEYTFIGPNGNSVIDYGICSKYLYKLVENFEIDTRTESCHSPIIITYKLRSPEIAYSENEEAPELRTRYIFDQNNINKYKLSIQDNLNSGKLDEILKDIESRDSNIEQILRKCQNLLLESGDCCRKTYTTRLIKNKPWFNGTCKSMKAEKNRALRQYRQSRTAENLNKYKYVRTCFKQQCRLAKAKNNNDKMESLINSSGSPKTFWRKLKVMSDKKAKVKNDITLDEWKVHFEGLFEYIDAPNYHENDMHIFEEPPELDDLEDFVFNSEITEEEILRVVRALKPDKSAGPDNIVPGLFINCIELILPILHKLFDRLFELGEFPSDWCNSIIVPLHKRGNINEPTNYRGISLLDVFGKIYTGILNRRITFYVNMFDILPESQSGFRENYSTIDNAFILQSLIDRYISRKGRKLYVAFVDFKQAFDRVNREKMWSVLQKAGIKGKLFYSLTQIYKQVKAQVRSNCGLSDSFSCMNGLRQGCMLSPALFTLFINEFSDLIENSGIPGVQLFSEDIQVLILLFADDIALISDTIVGLQRQLQLLKDYCLESKLVVNIVKTKVLVFKMGGRISSHEKWHYDGNLLEVVNCFTYVGLTFTMHLSLNRMSSDLAKKGKRVLVSLLSALYEYGQMQKHIFFTLFDMKVVPILLYGSEIWGFKKHNLLEQVQYYACERYMCVGMKSCNAAVLGDCGRFPLYIETAKRCLRNWIRILKMPQHRLVKKCYNMMKYFDELGSSNWCTRIKLLLQSAGLNYAWEVQDIQNEAVFIATFVQRLKDQYIQNWFSDINTNRKLVLYKDFKMNFSHEYYLDVISVRKFRHALAQIRTGHHPLEIETGRYTNIPRKQRLCIILFFAAIPIMTLEAYIYPKSFT